MRGAEVSAAKMRGLRIGRLLICNQRSEIGNEMIPHSDPFLPAVRFTEALLVSRFTSRHSPSAMTEESTFLSNVALQILWKATKEATPPITNL